MENQRRKISPTVLAAALVLVGFTAVTAQIVFMRELIVVFQGNEISLGVLLACWLFWTATGSVVLGRRIQRFPSPVRTVARLEAAAAVLLPATILAVRAARLVFHATPGEILGPGPAFLTALVALGPFCLVSGGLFAAGSSVYRSRYATDTATAGGSVYLLEAVGSCIGGLLAGLVLVRVMAALEIALVISLLNAAAVVALTRPYTSRRNAALWLVAGAALTAVLFPAGHALESFSLRYLWRGYSLLQTRNSIYGNLAVTETGGTRSVFANGLLYFNVPDPQTAEENVYYALLQHPSPQRVLLIGGGLSGGLNNTLQHPGLLSVDYVEMDPAVLDLARTHLGGGLALAEADARVHVFNVDGRLFVKRAKTAYDVVIVNLPDPQTAQLNRLYTVEFFRDVFFKLAPGGLLSFQVGGSDNYVSDDLAAFLSCLEKTLAQVFPETTVFPGSTVHFFAAVEEGALTSDPDLLLRRLRERDISTTYLREYYLPFRLAPDRLQDLESQMKSSPYGFINRDLTPVAYFFDAVLWSARFNRPYAGLLRSLARVEFARVAVGLAAILLVVVIAVLFSCRRGKAVRAGAGMCAAAMGLSTIGLEVVLLLAFQAIYGYVYQQLAVLIAGFMAGLALGSFVSLRGRARNSGETGATADRKALLLVQLALVTGPLVLVWLLSALTRFSGAAWLFLAANVCFPVLALLLGGLGGYQFPVASRMFYRGKTSAGYGPGAVYALDLAGACVGAALVSGYVLPVFGFVDTAVLLAIVNLAPLVVLISAGRRALDAPNSGL